MTTLLVVLAVGAGSYLMRSGPILWHGRAQPPPWVDRAALLAATSALSAVVTSAVLHHERAGHPEARMAAIVAVAVALALAARRVSMLRVIVAGARGLRARQPRPRRDLTSAGPASPLALSVGPTIAADSSRWGSGGRRRHGGARRSTRARPSTSAARSRAAKPATD